MFTFAFAVGLRPTHPTYKVRQKSNP